MKIKPAKRVGAVRFEVDSADEKMLGAALPSPEVEFRIILVPIDFSACSEKALGFSVRFSRQFKAKLVLLHVAPSYADPYFVTEFGPLQADVVRIGEERLLSLIEEVVPNDVPVQPLVRIGRPATSIVDAAHELGADLIIISTHGYTGIKHVVFGSTAENVVRHAPCPVMTLRAKRKNSRKSEETLAAAEQ
jgi:nucleotide-binding universal stress UspA family protein